MSALLNGKAKINLSSLQPCQHCTSYNMPIAKLKCPPRPGLGAQALLYRVLPGIYPLRDLDKGELNFFTFLTSLDFLRILHIPQASTYNCSFRNRILTKHLGHVFSSSGHQRPCNTASAYCTCQSHHCCTSNHSPDICFPDFLSRILLRSSFLLPVASFPNPVSTLFQKVPEFTTPGLKSTCLRRMAPSSIQLP